MAPFPFGARETLVVCVRAAFHWPLEVSQQVELKKSGNPASSIESGSLGLVVLAMG